MKTKISLSLAERLVEQIDEELVTGHFLSLLGTPEKSLVKVLSNDWFLPDLHGFSVTPVLPVMVLMVVTIVIRISSRSTWTPVPDCSF